MSIMVLLVAAACWLPAGCGVIDVLIFIDSHNSKTAVPHMDVKRAEELIDTGLIAGGMVPKVQGCLHALESGVGEVSILDGHCEHVLLLDVLHQRVSGTILTP